MADEELTGADKAKLMGIGAGAGLLAAGVMAAVFPPFALLGFIGFGILGQRTGMKIKARNIAHRLEDGDDKLFDCVEDERPDVRGARITHSFSLENTAIIPLFNTGTVREEVDFRTNKRKRRVDVTF